MASAGVWCLTESDPGVFSGLIRDIGVEGVQVEELYLPEKEALIPLRPVFGLIFLFKWTGEKDSRPCETDNPDVFFARQVITNACATQAILSILLNRREISLGQTLGDFLEFTRDLDPEMRGVALSNSDRIREVHNSYARVDSLMFDDGESKSGKKEDAFHFISYVPIHGALYELDGLKPGPINLGPCTDEDWEEKCLEVIRERMNKYQQSSTEIRFNLMAVVQDRIQLATQKLDVLNPRLDQLRRKVQALQAGGQFGEENDLPSSVDELLGMKVALEDERHALHDEIEAEKLKRQRYQRENERRRHNFIPLIHALLVAMADKGKLLPLIESSKTKPSKPSSK